MSSVFPALLRGNFIERWLQTKAHARLDETSLVPDFIIGRRDDPQVLRWYVIPRNKFFNIYLHCFLRSDADFALHDHPWLWNASYIWEGGYYEQLADDDAQQETYRVYRPAASWKFRWGKSPHRVELALDLDNVPADRICWTIFITGPKVPKWWREWGFYCPKGFIPFHKIVKYRTNKGSEPMDGCP
jgi:hypothetical protein